MVSSNVFPIQCRMTQWVAVWPFFGKVDMLLFIAPVSAFNQTLSEDRKVNRLVSFVCLWSLSERRSRLWLWDPQWDSFLLWKSLCMHKLLKKATFVLLLNKYDILDAKLRSGIQFREFVTSFKDRPNNTKNVLECKSDFYMTIKPATD